MYSFGRESLAQRETCHPDLKRVLDEAIRVYNFSIIKGHRGQIEQDAAYASKHSKLRWPNGNHNSYPSNAVDVAPYHWKYGRLIGTDAQIAAIAQAEGKSKEWAATLLAQHFCHLGGVMLAFAASKGIELIWGNDWDADNDLFENTFRDYGHFERRRRP